MKFKEDDLVMLRLPNDADFEGRQPHYNTWFRVMFIDNDGSFIGVVEKTDKEFRMYEIGQHIMLDAAKVQRIYNRGDQFCYSDGVTVCNCSSLCRNK
ncbi:hypothetical protein [Parapedobacter lycopersici]|uniref:hypothetical protein n=1 Tax=Parapedobacter lycopersici TaxID=1864939 RepID=UPI00214DE154|nr:hypothetical protein [Parapedobacter lycopersici]